VDREQRRHRGERRADEHDARILAADADERQRERCERRRDRAEPDPDEMDLHAEVARAVVTEKMEACAGENRPCTDERDERDQPVAKEEPHRIPIGCALRDVEGRTA
jgi:hypothetical protein